ncbi:hypothetical protein CDIK_0198 [Cucumispora dikerogammari]|nr:hypothetical protein CDIK_0198 [Cucumispora dikerogammari]
MHDESSDEILAPTRSNRQRFQKSTPINSNLEIVHERKPSTKKQKPNKLQKLFDESEDSETCFSDDFDQEIDDELFIRIFGTGKEYKMPIHTLELETHKEEKYSESPAIIFSDEEIINHVKLKYEISEEVILALKNGINVNFVAIYMEHKKDIHELFEIEDCIKSYKKYIETINACKKHNPAFDYQKINSLNEAAGQLDYFAFQIKDEECVVGKKILPPDELLINLETEALKFISSEKDFELKPELIETYARKISKSPIFVKACKDKNNNIPELTKALNIFQNKDCKEIISRAIKMITYNKTGDVKNSVFNEIFSFIINTSYCKLLNKEHCCVVTNFNNFSEFTILDNKFNYISKMRYNKVFIEKITEFLNNYNPKFILFAGDSLNTMSIFYMVKETNSSFPMFYYFCKYLNMSTLTPKDLAKLVTVPEIVFLLNIDKITSYFKNKVKSLSVFRLKQTVLNAILTSISFCKLDYNEISEPEIFNYFDFCLPRDFKYNKTYCDSVTELKDVLSLNDVEFTNFATFFTTNTALNNKFALLNLHPALQEETNKLTKEINIDDSKSVLSFYELNKMLLTETQIKILSMFLFERPKFKGASNKQIFKLLVNFDEKYLNTKHKVVIKGSNKTNSFANVNINNKVYPVAIAGQLEGAQLIEIQSVDYTELRILAEHVPLKEFPEFTNNPLFSGHLTTDSAKQKLLTTNSKIVIIKDEIQDEIQILCKIGKNSVRTFCINEPVNFRVENEIFSNFKEFREEFLVKFLENIQKIYESGKVFTEKSEVARFFSGPGNLFCFLLTPEKDYDFLVFKNNVKNKYKVNVGKFISCKNETFSDVTSLIKSI